MKKLIALLVLGITAAAQADVITLWDFNSLTPDFNANTGTFSPQTGVGTSINIGNTNSFGSVGGGGSSDPNPNGDNSMVRLGAFPAASAGNKTAGMQYLASTVGYENITFNWDHYNSATGSRYWRIQYTTNGTTWTDFIVYTNTAEVTWHNSNVANFSGITAVNNNPNFGVRLVAEFASTATGSGAASYTGTQVSGGYSANGTLWTDMAIISGDIINTNNTNPTISAIADQSIRANQSLGPIAFTVGDAETSAGALTLSSDSSNPGLIQNITFGGSGASRTVSLTPVANQYGSAQITVTVTDAGTKTASSLFNVVVRPPTLAITNANQSILMNSSGTANIQIVDSAAFLGTMTLSADSTNATLFPPGSLLFSGTGTSRTLTFTPATGQLGGSLVSVIATDGSLSTTSAMFLKVVATNTIALWDFNSRARDNSPNTGDIGPAVGSGTATSSGTATNSLNSNVSAASSDLDQQDNTKWRFGSFPTNGLLNKTSGAEFHVSTVGYQNIAISWDHYNSATGSRYWRLQTSTDGTTFTDTSFIYTNPVETTWAPTGTSLASIPGVNNNPNFAVRLVAEFESTATGAGADSYIGTAAAGNYSTGGTLWLDMVTFTGETYVPSANPTTLQVSQLTGGNIQISWPASVNGTLQGNTSLSTSNWVTVAQSPVVNGTNKVVTISNPTGTKFFRLLQ